MIITKTTIICDGCGKQVESIECLNQNKIHVIKSKGFHIDKDFCITCQGKLLYFLNHISEEVK